MQIEKYDRKPFSVEAVEVTFENIYEVAEWCKGTVIKQPAKMLGVKTEVPAIRLAGQGDDRGKSFIASLGCYVVNLKGHCRVYKPQQFKATFEPAVEVEHLIEDESPQEAQKNEYVCNDEVLDTVDDTFDDNSCTDGQETAVASI